MVQRRRMRGRAHRVGKFLMFVGKLWDNDSFQIPLHPSMVELEGSLEEFNNVDALIEVTLLGQQDNRCQIQLPVSSERLGDTVLVHSRDLISTENVSMPAFTVIEAKTSDESPENTEGAFQDVAKEIL